MSSKLLKNILKPDLGCGSCGTSRRNLTDDHVFHPNPKPKVSQLELETTRRSPKSHSAGVDQYCSLEMEMEMKMMVSQYCPKVSGSLVVVKESSDPYYDFRDSMFRMVIEKDIYLRDDLQQLLNCFLKLNANTHHDTIVKASKDIWNFLAVISTDHS